jgi:hypothetical protein
MNYSHRLTRAGMVLAILLAGAMTSCTILGLVIGSTSDKNQPEALTVPGWEVNTLQVGAQIDILKKDGTQVSGKYTGMELLSVSDYARPYGEARSRLPEGVYFPALGNSITMIFASPDQKKSETSSQTGKFFGFELGHIRFVVNTGRTTNWWRRSLDDLITLSNQQGNTVTGKTIRNFVYERKIPLLSAVAVMHKGKKRVVAIDSIQQIHQFAGKGYGALTGFLVGAAIDAAVVMITLSSLDFPTGLSGENGSMSCPFVYSFDGRQYVLDSETFGGAIFRAAQRTDVDNLDHLAELAGTYRVKLTNELQETQYVDELKLLVVDHPRNTRIIPSFSGSMHTFSSLLSPSQASDFRGNEVRALVTAKDDQVWVSNPFGRNPENKAEVRDGLLLEFPRPANATAAKLLCNVQNTLWASYLQGQLLALHGRELPNWYALMNSSATARAALAQAMIREGMLQIKLWNGTSWQDAGFVWEVGPSVPKDQAVWLDLKNIPGESLRIKLESTAGFWMINHVAIDYTPDTEIKVTELAPVQAFDHLHREVREVLTNNDGRYYEMPTTQDWAELVFAAPPSTKGYQRSVLLKSAGYYEIHVSAEGKPQRELLAKLMTEPGAYGQYTLRLLQGYVDATLAKGE